MACLSLMGAPVVVAEQDVDFARDVAPIFEQHCVRCHSSLTDRGDLSLETAAGLKQMQLVVPGDPDGSSLLDVITAADGQKPRMPEQGPPVPADQVATLRRWIQQGAVWPADVVVRERSKAGADWWSLQPLQQKFSAHSIDQFIDARLTEHQLQRSPEADRRTLIRRLTFDLTGLPPTVQEVHDFLADSDPGAYDRLVERLLASPAFGERWARHWLDIAHYADTHGFERDKRRDTAWRYRDYVIRAFNDDKPYDQFLHEQIAGDVLAPHSTDSVIATGFLAAGPWDYVGQVETKSPVLRRSARALDLDDMVTQVMTATLGMTANCARCHDHKLDPILQRDYYQLTAVFAGLKRAEREINDDARTEYVQTRQRLEKRIRELSSEVARLQGHSLNVADVVGGGDGFGSGKTGQGVDPRTGVVQEKPLGDLSDVRAGNFSTSTNLLIDGVFVPAEQQTQISSTGLFADQLPANSGKAWDAIRNGPVTSQFSTQLGGVDYQSEGHSMIGLHANAGLTFDLQAIRKQWTSTHGADEPSTSDTAESAGSSAMIFTAVAGYGGRPQHPSAEYRVLLDGKLQAYGRLGREDADALQVAIPAAAKFLTLISTDGGDGYGHDQVSFGDPVLSLQRPAGTTDDQEVRLAELRAERKAAQAELRTLSEPPTFYGVVAEDPPAVSILVRGDPESPADETVAPGALGWTRQQVIFGDSQMPEADRRVALAKWITEDSGALAARVIVNRLWHWHFGKGIVDTPSDFGYGGGRPSHPKLLDWLAQELIQSDWSLKHIHRLIVTSQTWRQASGSDDVPQLEAALQRDSDNRLLWRMNARRLEAEAVRDAVLAVTGKINRTMYGPGYQDFGYQEAYAPIYTYQTADSPVLWRRSIYRFIVRTTPQQFLATLDCADPANLTPDRNVTTTALQSLALFNNDFMLRQSEYLAQRLRAKASSAEQQIELAFQLLFGRPVTAEELQLTEPLVRGQGLMHLCRVLLNTNEFVYVD